MQKYFTRIHDFSWLFDEKNIEFLMEANFQRNIAIVSNLRTATTVLRKSNASDNRRISQKTRNIGDI